jgi:hypothetical protein
MLKSYRHRIGHTIKSFFQTRKVISSFSHSLLNLATFAKMFLLNKLVLILFLISSILVVQCNKEGVGKCFKGTGNPSTQLRTVPDFKDIYIEDNMDLFLKQGAVQEIKIEGGENLIPYIRTEVVGNELRIKNENRCNWARSYKKGKIKITITNPIYFYIKQYGSGLISSIDTLRLDTFKIYTRETGDMNFTIKTHAFFIQSLGTTDLTVKGSTGVCGIFHTGEGYIYCQDLSSMHTWTYSEASGNEYLNASVALYINLNWVGDIYYKNNPTVYVKEKKGTGNLIRFNP